jgi:hypothetical protein
MVSCNNLANLRGVELFHTPWIFVRSVSVVKLTTEAQSARRNTEGYEYWASLLFTNQMQYSVDLRVLRVSVVK